MKESIENEDAVLTSTSKTLNNLKEDLVSRRTYSDPTANKALSGGFKIDRGVFPAAEAIKHILELYKRAGGPNEGVRNIQRFFTNPNISIEDKKAQLVKLNSLVERYSDLGKYKSPVSLGSKALVSWAYDLKVPIDSLSPWERINLKSDNEDVNWLEDAKMGRNEYSAWENKEEAEQAVKDLVKAGFKEGGVKPGLVVLEDPDNPGIWVIARKRSSTIVSNGDIANWWDIVETPADIGDPEYDPPKGSNILGRILGEDKMAKDKKDKSKTKSQEKGSKNAAQEKGSKNAAQEKGSKNAASKAEQIEKLREQLESILANRAPRGEAVTEAAAAPDLTSTAAAPDLNIDDANVEEMVLDFLTGVDPAEEIMIDSPDDPIYRWLVEMFPEYKFDVQEDGGVFINGRPLTGNVLSEIGLGLANDVNGDVVLSIKSPKKSDQVPREEAVLTSTAAKIDENNAEEELINLLDDADSTQKTAANSLDDLSTVEPAEDQVLSSTAKKVASERKVLGPGIGDRKIVEAGGSGGGTPLKMNLISATQPSARGGTQKLSPTQLASLGLMEKSPGSFFGNDPSDAFKTIKIDPLDGKPGVPPGLLKGMTKTKAGLGILGVLAGLGLLSNALSHQGDSPRATSALEGGKSDPVPDSSPKKSRRGGDTRSSARALRAEMQKDPKWVDIGRQGTRDADEADFYQRTLDAAFKLLSSQGKIHGDPNTIFKQAFTEYGGPHMDSWE